MNAWCQLLVIPGMRIRQSVSLASLPLTLAVSGGSALAAPVNYVQNGSFENNTGIGMISPGGPAISLPSWTKTCLKDCGDGFAFVINQNADSAGFDSGGGNIKIWGPNTPVGTTTVGGKSTYPVPNGFPNGGSAAPDGNFWVGIDGDWQRSSLSQTLSLTAGTQYTLSFVYAGSQFTDELGATEQYWTASVGGSTYTTPTMSVPSQGWTGWNKYETTFTASGSDVLTFTSYGGPVGGGTASLPPFLMLDNVQVIESTPPPPPSAVPGPLPLLGVGTAFAFSRRLRRRIANAETTTR
jgi:hypothetical protein